MRMEAIRDMPFAGPAVWRRGDAHRVSEVTGHFSGDDLISNERSHLPRSVWTGDQVLPAGVGPHLLTTLGEIVDHVRSELLNGPGFALLRGFGTDALDLEEVEKRYFELGSQLGPLVPQNDDGDLLRNVTDLGEPSGDHDAHRALGHRGRAPMNPHTDSADIAALLCVRPARSGGASAVCSAAALYNAILARRPEFLKPLCRGFHFDLTGKAGTGLGFTEWRIPVFSHRNGKLSCVFNKERIALGMKKANQPLDGLELASIEYLDALAKSDEFTIRILLKAGDVLFLNNRCTLHARDEYDDWPQASRKRLLLRLWMNLLVPWDSTEPAE
jgi:hypothetical protein